MAESVANTARLVAGAIKIPFASRRASEVWEQFLSEHLDVRQNLTNMLRSELVDDIDRGFISTANAERAGQPDRNDDILVPVTQEMYEEGMRRLRDNPPVANEPSMLINQELIEEIRQWGVNDRPGEGSIAAGDDMPVVELLGVSMIRSPVNPATAFFNEDLGEEYDDPADGLAPLTPVESMRATMRMWVTILCHGQTPWIVEAEMAESPIAAVRDYIQRRTQEDGVYRQILPPLAVISTGAADRHSGNGVPGGLRSESYQIGWPTPATGLRALGLVVQDAHGVPNTLSSGQENSENGQSSRHSFRDRSGSDRAVES